MTGESSSTTFAENVAPMSDPLKMARANPESRFEKRMAEDAAFAEESIVLARSIPEARGLEEIRDPFLKAKVADALDIGRDPSAMLTLAKVLNMKYPRAADKVRKQAQFLAKAQSKVF